jgi:hypothetical protein
MRTQVAETSLVAYHSLQAEKKLSAKQALIMGFLSSGTAMTRQELVNVTGEPINSVTGRVNELLTAKRIVIRGEVVNQKTGKPNYLVGIPIVEQFDLFQ